MAISCAAVGSATGGSHGAVEARVSELRRARGGGRAATSDCVRARIAKRTDHHPNFGRKSTLELAAFDDAAACRKDPSKREGGELKSRQNSTARRQPKTRRNCRNSKPQPRCCSPAPPRSTALRAAQPLHKSALIVRPEWLCCAPWPRASRCSSHLRRRSPSTRQPSLGAATQGQLLPAAAPLSTPPPRTGGRERLRATHSPSPGCARPARPSARRLRARGAARRGRCSHRGSRRRRRRPVEGRSISGRTARPPGRRRSHRRAAETSPRLATRARRGRTSCATSTARPRGARASRRTRVSDAGIRRCRRWWTRSTCGSRLRRRRPAWRSPAASLPRCIALAREITLGRCIGASMCCACVNKYIYNITRVIECEEAPLSRGLRFLSVL